MSPLYPYPKELPVRAYISLITVPILLVGLVIWAFRNNHVKLLFGLAFFTFNIMFLLQIVRAGQGFMADRFTYIAYIGLFLLLAFAYDWIYRNKPQFKGFLNTGVVAYLAILGFMTNKQTKIWENSGTLWEHTLKYFSNNDRPWANAARYYREEEKNFSKAIEYYSRVLKFDINKTATYNSLGTSYFQQAAFLSPNSPDVVNQKNQLTQLAIQNYSYGLLEDSVKGRKDPKATAELMINLGVAHASLGMYDIALKEFTNGLKIDSLNKSGYANRALLYYFIQQYELAIQDHNEYLNLDPYNATAYADRGVCKRALGQEKSAMTDLNRAVELNPKEPKFFVERSKARKATGDIAGARTDAIQAQQMGGNVPADLLQ